MEKESIKQRQKRAINAAIKYLNKPIGTYKVLILNDSIFHVEAIRVKEIRKIRIVLDEITDEDIKIVKEFRLPEVCTKEIWYKKFKEGDFEIKKIL